MQPQPSPPRRVRILVIDDNEDAVQMLARLLAALGYEARAATSGPAALQEANAFQPEVVLLDLGMPEMDGFETAARLRRQPWGRQALLIAVTGWGQPKDKERTRAAGFAAHLVKPLDIEALLKLLPKS